MAKEIRKQGANFAELSHELPDPFNAPVISYKKYEPFIQVFKRRELDVLNYWKKVWREDSQITDSFQFSTLKKPLTALFLMI